MTTPESLYLLLTSKGGREMLRTTETIILDEIHALVNEKRGSHLSLSVERLEDLCGRKLQRIGLSATQKPIGQVARFLTGNHNINASGVAECALIDEGHQRLLDLAIEVPKSPLTAVMANEVWEEIHARLEVLILEHDTTLIFVNTRRLTERLAHHLSKPLGEAHVAAHHGSLSKEARFDAEQKLKSGKLRCLIATASMELGIDIGSVDLVCQLSSPKSISGFLQRVGRSGHSVGGKPKGRIFPLTRDDLVECAAILDAVRRGELDKIVMPEMPLDILSQQIVAEVACGDRSEKELFELYKRAFPYRNLSLAAFEDIIAMLSEGFTTRKGRRGAYLHHDIINGVVKPRKAARLVALTNGGAIPDTFDYEVRMEPTNIFVGTLNEDFAIESIPGDIVQLGNNSWRILRIETGTVRVEDAHGQPPSIPFWLGEAPGRTRELSEAVSRLREEISSRIIDTQLQPALDWLQNEVGIMPAASSQIVNYLADVQVSLGTMPTRKNIVLERFFDEVGDMHLVIHSPFGSRLNRAWGLSLRKKFCRHFNFELQAAATEDAIVLSLGSTHSFPVDEVFSYLNADSVREVLIQALLDAPMFGIRFRWNASRALAIRRNNAGKRVPAQFQRMNSEDLIALVFPDQLACLENIAGDREVPDHPLVYQAIQDCLHEVMDIDELEELLRDIQGEKIELHALDLREPSLLSQEIITAKPYAFLDPAPLEERRTQAIAMRRWVDPQMASDLTKLDYEAITQVKLEAWPTVRDADELHDALVLHSYFTEEEGKAGEIFPENWQPWFDQLREEGRATLLSHGNRTKLWVAAERLPQFNCVFPGHTSEPQLSLPARLLRGPGFQLQGGEKVIRPAWEYTDALKEIVRGRLECLGPVTSVGLADSLGLPESDISYALGGLENEGFVFRGHFTVGHQGLEWCERRLLARVHRYTLDRLRQEIKPVSTQDYMRFLLSWHRLGADNKGHGPEALQDVLRMLEGYEAPAASWEGEILPARLANYDPVWLDVLCLSGRVLWARFRMPAGSTGSGGSTVSGPIKSSPIALVSREEAPLFRKMFARLSVEKPDLSPPAQKTVTFLQRMGASFFDDIARVTRLLPTELENALAELVSLGLVTSDSFTGLRALLTPGGKKPSPGKSRGNKRALFGMESAGRWSLIANHAGFLDDVTEYSSGELNEKELERIARILLRRYGVMFRRVADREAGAPPWRELIRIYRQMEARGTVRGGRFVEGVYGEQYALPEAVGKLRKISKQPKTGELIAISAADPLNLAGIVLPGNKVAARSGNRLLFRDGVVIASLESKEISFLHPVPEREKWELQKFIQLKEYNPRLRAYLGN